MDKLPKTFKFYFERTLSIGTYHQELRKRINLNFQWTFHTITVLSILYVLIQIPFVPLRFQAFTKKNQQTHASSIRHSMSHLSMHLSRRGTAEPMWKLLKSVVFIRPILSGLREQSRITWFAYRCFKKDEANFF